MKILAMDTATPHGGAALLQGDRLVAEARLADAPGHGVSLPVAVAGLMQRAGWRWPELELLVVTLGPGSFTGVRLALGFAKGVALAWPIPLVGVSTLAALAAGAARQEGEWILALLDARRGEVFAGLYQVQEGGVAPRGAMACLPPQGLRQVFEPQVTGALRVVGAAHLLVDWPVAAAGSVVEFSALSRAGLALFRQRGGADGLLEPLYIRPSEAEAKKALAAS